MSNYFLTTDDLIYLDNLFTEGKKVSHYASWNYYFKNYLRNHESSLGSNIYAQFEKHKNNAEEKSLIYQKLSGKIELENANFFNYLKSLIKKDNYKKLEMYFFDKVGYYVIAKKMTAHLTSTNLKYIHDENNLKFYQWALKEKYIALDNKSIDNLEKIVNQKTQSKVAILKEIVSIFEMYVKTQLWSEKITELFVIALQKQKNIPVAEQKRIRKITELLDEKFTSTLKRYFSDIEKEEFLSIDSQFLNMITINYNTILNHEQNQASKTEIKNRVRNQSYHITTLINRDFTHIARVLSRTEDGSKLMINLISKKQDDLDLLTKAIFNYLNDITLKTEDRQIKDEFPIYFEKMILEKKFSNQKNEEDNKIVEEKRKNRKI